MKDLGSLGYMRHHTSGMPMPGFQGLKAKNILGRTNPIHLKKIEDGELFQEKIKWTTPEKIINLSKKTHYDFSNTIAWNFATPFIQPRLISRNMPRLPPMPYRG